jgi:hypothetical protein
MYLLHLKYQFCRVTCVLARPRVITDLVHEIAIPTDVPASAVAVGEPHPGSFQKHLVHVVAIVLWMVVTQELVAGERSALGTHGGRGGNRLFG